MRTHPLQKIVSKNKQYNDTEQIEMFHICKTFFVCQCSNTRLHLIDAQFGRNAYATA